MIREDYRMAMEQERHDRRHDDVDDGPDPDLAHDRMVEDAIEMAELAWQADAETAAAVHMGQAMGRILDAAGGRS